MDERGGKNLVVLKSEINEILTDNSMDWNFDTVPSQYYDFSFEKIKEKFINFKL